MRIDEIKEKLAEVHGSFFREQFLLSELEKEHTLNKELQDRIDGFCDNCLAASELSSAQERCKGLEEALTNLVKEVAENDLTSCDHEAGICNCAMTVVYKQAIAKLAGEVRG